MVYARSVCNYRKQHDRYEQVKMVDAVHVWGCWTDIGGQPSGCGKAEEEYWWNRQQKRSGTGAGGGGRRDREANKAHVANLPVSIRGKMIKMSIITCK